jgi:two-component system nitrate/nitrite response regulator NarL
MPGLTGASESTMGDGLGRPRLIIADDDPVVRSALGSQLAGDFEIVGSASTAAEAAELAEAHRPEAALVDVVMPGGDGLEAVREIRRRSPETRIVMLSADESRESVVKLLDEGATAYVRKGVPAPEITRTLLDALKADAG